MDFEKLHVIKRVENKNGKSMWLCRCDCGNETVVPGYCLTTMSIKSCGCLRVKHNMYKTKLYGVWGGMKDRCSNLNNKNYHRYGGRGISVCDEWLDFNNFYDWAMHNGYNDNLTIERINVNGNYESSNCEWITISKQGLNRENTNRWIVDGKEWCEAELCREYGINKCTFRARIKSGWSLMDSLTTPTYINGIKNAHRKLSDENIKYIKENFIGGRGKKTNRDELAEKFNVSKGYISDIANEYERSPRTKSNK